MLGWKLSALSALVFLVLTIVVASEPTSDVWWPFPLAVAVFNGVFAIVEYRGERRRKNGV